MAQITQQLIDNLSLYSNIDKLQEILTRLNNKESFVFNPKELFFDTASETKIIELFAEGLDWVIEVNDSPFGGWLSVSKLNGTGNSSISVTVIQNPSSGGVARTATIKATSGEKQIFVSVSQEALP